MTKRRCRSCPRACPPLPSPRGLAGVRRVLLLLLLLGATSARAASPSCQSDSVCRAEFKRASELYLQADYEGALSAFRAAHARQAEPRILLNIGRTLHKLDRPEEALTEYQRCWNSAAPTDRDLFKTLDQYMSEARDLLAQKRQAARKTDDPPAVPAATSAADGKAQPGISQTDTRKPIYKKAWFWAVIGGVAAVGIVVGAVAGTQARPAGPDPLPHHISF